MDLNSAAAYIEMILRNPKAADELLDQADAVIGSLKEFPERHALVDDDLLKSWGIRYVAVDHYLAFYRVDSKERKVTIVRFLHEKRNWAGLLDPR